MATDSGDFFFTKKKMTTITIISLLRFYISRSVTISRYGRSSDLLSTSRDDAVESSSAAESIVLSIAVVSSE